MTDHNELNNNMSTEQAAKLLLESISPLHTGGTIITGKIDANKDIERQLAAYVEIDPESEFGHHITDLWKEIGENDGRTTDNQTRWSMINHGNVAKIVLEAEEIDENNEAKFRGVIAFEYPRDREFLMIAAYSGWIMIRAGESVVNLSRPNKLTKIPRRDQRDYQVLEISTGPQVGRMVEIMDKRNPSLVKRSLKQVLSDMNVAHSPIADMWLKPWEKLHGSEQIMKVLREMDNPLGAAIGIFTTLAVHSVLTDSPQSGEQIAEQIDSTPEAVEATLIAVFQSDTPWAWGHQHNDEWVWIKSPDTPMISETEYDGLNLMKSEDRLKLAVRLLNEIGVEVPLEELAPSLALTRSIIDFAALEGKMISILNKKTPVWTGAKGFAKTYESAQEAARMLKREGIKNSNALNALHVHVGHSLQIAHVVTMTSDQFLACPELHATELEGFIKNTVMPFDPFFLDLTADEKLVHINKVEFALGGEIRILGALLNTSPSDSDVLFITPVLYYPLVTEDGNHGNVASVLGSLAINKSGIRNKRFSFIMGGEEKFDTGDMKIVIAMTNALEHRQDLIQAYGQVIGEVSERIISALYLIEAANVELVPRELDRRERKRQEKRRWLIPLTVRVKRPSPRGDRSQNGHEEVEWSHQWEVMGHPRHLVRGPAVWCIVCQGRETEDLVCPRCHGTGLDPDKVKPCHRIDVRTGEKTCPDGCRIVMVSPHVKGPTDKPLVIKTRKII